MSKFRVIVENDVETQQGLVAYKVVEAETAIEALETVLASETVSPESIAAIDVSWIS